MTFERTTKREARRVICRRVGEGDLEIMFPGRFLWGVLIFLYAGGWLGLAALLTVVDLEPEPVWFAWIIPLPACAVGLFFLALAAWIAFAKSALYFTEMTVTRVSRFLGRERRRTYRLDPEREAVVEATRVRLRVGRSRVVWRLSIPTAGRPLIPNHYFAPGEAEQLAAEINRWMAEQSAGQSHQTEGRPFDE